MAVKTLADSGRRDSRLRERFAREASALSGLKHPNLVEVIETGDDGGRPFLVIEHLETRSLSWHMQNGSRFGHRQAVRLVYSLADGVHALHAAGMVHRRVQPAWVLLGSDGRSRLQEPPFIVQRRPGVADQAVSGHEIEPIRYLAPEQFDDDLTADPRTDVYGLGATLFGLVAGRAPFDQVPLERLAEAKRSGKLTPLEQLVTAVPEQVADAVAAAMAPRPDERPATAAQFAEILSEALERFGQYVLLEQIGHGNSGNVYRARDGSGRLVALKMLAGPSAQRNVRVVRFHREAKLAREIEHPGLVRALDVGHRAGRHFIAMEYVDGGNLAKHIMRNGRLSELASLRILAEVAEALHCIHDRGIVHRDVNPANILLTRDGRAKLGDLGLSKQVESDVNLTLDGTGLGTPQYIAPEQFRGAKEVDCRCDVYGLGATLYVMVTGKLPFSGRTDMKKLLAKSNNDYPPPEAVVSDLTQGVVDLIKQAMAADPRQRPPTAADFAERARKCLSDIESGAAQRAAAAPPIAPQGKVWHVASLTQGGDLRRFEATEKELLDRIASGEIGAEARVSQSPTGPFEPISAFRPFRKALRKMGRTARQAARGPRPTFAGLRAAVGAMAGGVRRGVGRLFGR